MKHLLTCALAVAMMTTAAHAEDAIKRDPAINWNLPIEPSQERTSMNEEKKRIITTVGVIAIIGLAVAAVVAGPGSVSK